MNTWLKHLKTAIALNNSLVVITIIATKGSTPCSNGDKIVFRAMRLSLEVLEEEISNLERYLWLKKCLLLRVIVTSLLSTHWAPH